MNSYLVEYLSQSPKVTALAILAIRPEITLAEIRAIVEQIEAERVEEK